MPIDRWLQRRLVYIVVKNLEDLLVKLKLEENEHMETIEENEERDDDFDLHNEMVGWL